MSILDNVAGGLLNAGLNALSSTAQNFITSKLNALANILGMELPIALYGDMTLGIMTYFSGMDETMGVDYAEHALIGGKPRLQDMGDKLDEIKWNVVFHSMICDPEVEVLKLKKAMRDHVALPLVFANGDYKGRFVPTAFSITTRQTMRDGSLIWVEGSMSLREYVAPPVLAEATPKQPAVAATKKGNKPAKTKRASAAKRGGSRPATRNAR